MTTFSEKFFCPAPWSHLYYQINSPSPCHQIRNHGMKMTPEEYYKSDWLNKIKTDFVEGRVPEECVRCKDKEDAGLKSTRGAIWQGYYNVGPEPHYEDMWFYNKYNMDTPSKLRRMEFRFSNLCNMKCRMCEETNSVEWAREKNEFNLAPQERDNDNDAFNTQQTPLITITDDKVAALKDLDFLSDLNHLCLTGGEPFLIKEYYDYLDFLIENDRTNITLEVFTNCSVWNPFFVERMLKFKRVELVMSIDGVGPAAEYIRHGVEWETVKTNVKRFNALPLPVNAQVTVAISALTVLNAVEHSKFLMELYEQNPKIFIKCYTVFRPGLKPVNAPPHIKAAMLERIDAAVEILTANNYKVFRNELLNIKKILLSDAPSKPHTFVEYISQFDKIRNESFEDTFGLPLHL